MTTWQQSVYGSPSVKMTTWQQSVYGSPSVKMTTWQQSDYGSPRRTASHGRASVSVHVACIVWRKQQRLRLYVCGRHIDGRICTRSRSNPLGRCYQERLTRGALTSTMRMYGRTSFWICKGGAGNGCSVIKS